jgi:hypothetical protein
VIGTVRHFIHALLANPPACPRCGSADVRLSHHVSPLARLGILRCRCRACEALFSIRSSQAPLAQQQARDYFADPAGHRRSSSRRRGNGDDADREHEEADAAAEPLTGVAGEREIEGRRRPPVDLEALDRDIAAARAAAIRDE